MSNGVDLSNNNGRVNWKLLSADTDFAWVKATEGRSYVDPYLDLNLKSARAAGLPIGAYHYARPDNNSADSEALHFLNVYKPQPGDLLPVLDFETHANRNPADMTAWAKRWMELVTQGLNQEVVFYSYPYFITGDMAGAYALHGTKLWLADYGANDGKRHKQGYVFPAFNQVCHQYTSNGHVAGVNGRVDLNYAPKLEVILQAQPKPPVVKKKSLPGPAKKPKWFWLALRQYLANRQKNT